MFLEGEELPILVAHCPIYHVLNKVHLLNANLFTLSATWGGKQLSTVLHVIDREMKMEREVLWMEASHDPSMVAEKVSLLSANSQPLHTDGLKMG